MKNYRKFTPTRKSLRKQGIQKGRKVSNTCVQILTITEEILAIPKIIIQTPSTTYLALLDAGCSKSFIVEKSIDNNNLKTIPQPLKLMTATEQLSTPQHYVTLTFQIDGCDFIRKHRLILDLNARIATLRHNRDNIITVPLVDHRESENNFLLN
ncbi:hypothetical protein PR048_001561 [Dryococelus australis]|uniref:Retropepsins domain-containing protein n=1 Tax=Dryococelus australis TaxID=614101 RepID=A0ABQ9IHP9_9NEOP|nr:hypothetical protein PR048_001561 [Dryococelus australis]